MQSDFASRYRAVERFIAKREFFGVKLGLDNIREFLEYLDNPEKHFPTVHVAGTNGKGSTVAMLGSVLRESGYSVGVFTSPHLVDFRERITVDGIMIDKRFVESFIRTHRREITKRKVTYFELMVALAYAYFAHKKVDIAVIETGLGGRLDATNTLDPLLSVITEISLDHVAILGDTLEKIAGEKGGIIKPGRPVALAKMPKEASDRLRHIARERKSRILALTSHCEALRFSKSMALKGAHQIDNLRTVITSLNYLKSQDYKISKRSIESGLKKTIWRGRFQRVSGPNESVIILDVGHNQTGMATFTKTFKTEFPRRRARTLIGLVEKKDHQFILDRVAEISDEIILTPLPTHRTTDPAELLPYLRDFSGPTHTAKSPKSAMKHALKNLTEDDILLVIGSHYLVGEFIKAHPQFFRNQSR